MWSVNPENSHLGCFAVRAESLFSPFFLMFHKSVNTVFYLSGPSRSTFDQSGLHIFCERPTKLDVLQIVIWHQSNKKQVRIANKTLILPIA